jgi:hypothetical protein
MEPSPPGDANIYYGRNNFPRILLNLEVHYRFHKSALLISIQKNEFALEYTYCY